MRALVYEYLSRKCHVARFDGVHSPGSNLEQVATYCLLRPTRKRWNGTWDPVVQGRRWPKPRQTNLYDIKFMLPKIVLPRRNW